MVDKVRASRDGHEFHELWIARLALGLINHQNDLTAIAIEGVSPKEKSTKNKEIIEIADAILFYGGSPTFELADKSRIVQVKYSVTSANVDYRNSHAKKTVSKFASSFKDLLKKLGKDELESKITFEIVTNRPIFEHFASAIKLLAANKKPSGESKKQAEQFKKASGLKGKHLRLFAKLFVLNGNQQNLPDNLKNLNRTLSNWSATNSALAKARAGSLKQLIRSKAGTEGEGNNLIEKTDVLAELGLETEDDLLPCSAYLNELVNVVERDSFNYIEQVIRQKNSPILISAAGGVGKSILLKNLECKLSDEYLTTVFDCFGGGNYRSPEDARHLPRNGLTHIVNTFSSDALCDPLIPADTATVEALLKTFRDRMLQVIEAIRSNTDQKGLILFLDAIDNSVEAANDSDQDCFPILLLKSIQHSGPIDGLKIVSTCRDHRKPTNFEGFFTEISLNPFSKEETTAFLKTRKPKLSDTQINVAFTRSGGNPRVLNHMIESEETVFDIEKINNDISLDELISEKIENALEEAKHLGSTSEEIELFLAGLCVLPPPAPIEEHSKACGVKASAISSFASDLAPLLDRYNEGLVFRDEPTETYIREKFGDNHQILSTLAKNLGALQEESSYASRALPHLLIKLEDEERLYELAFSHQYPQSITSQVGIQRVKKARVISALQYALKKYDYESSLPLLIELSTIVGSNSRVQNYLSSYPELVYESRDPESIRNLLEMRTPWPGTRFANSSVIQALNGQFEESDRNRSQLLGWLRHHYSRTDSSEQDTLDRDEPEPTILEAAAVAFSSISQGKIAETIIYLQRWRHWYGFNVTERLIQLLTNLDYNQTAIVRALDGELGVITAFIANGNLSNRGKISLVKKLSRQCTEKIEEIYETKSHNNRLSGFGSGLLKVAAFALQKNLKGEAKRILSAIKPERYGAWAFDQDTHNNYAKDYVFAFFLHTVLASYTEGKNLDTKSLLSKDLFEICNHVRRGKHDHSYKTRLKAALDDYVASDKNVRDDGVTKISKKGKETLRKHIDSDLVNLTALANEFSSAITCDSKTSLIELKSLLKCCSTISEHQDNYGRATANNFFISLGFECILFLLNVRSDYNEKHGSLILRWCKDHNVYTPLRQKSLAKEMANNNSLHEMAALQASLAAKKISQTDTDIDTRANFFGSIAQIIRQVDTNEADQYFKKGLRQLDSLGSGDYGYITELLNLLGSLEMDEVAPNTFHTLSNLVEINIEDEPEKFSWYSFSNAFSNIAGIRMLAKLARWHDRDIVKLHITLLPYLTTLLKHNKISPEIAVALNYLDAPGELYVCDSKNFIDELAKYMSSCSKDLVKSALQQYLNSNPSHGNYRTIQEIIEKHKQHIDKDTFNYLKKISEKLAMISQAHHRRDNFWKKQSFSRDIEEEKNNVDLSVKSLLQKTKPDNEEDIYTAIKEIEKLQGSRQATTDFLIGLSKKVSYADRYKYLNTIASITCIDHYQKLEELDRCLKHWIPSSTSLTENRKKLLTPILEFNLEDMFFWNRLSSSNLSKVSSVTSIPVAQIAVKIASIFIDKNIELSGAEWLGIAESIADKASKNTADKRVAAIAEANSDVLSSIFIEKAEPEEYYPENDETLVAANLIYLQLGSPNHQERWRACHSVRYLAEVNRWDVIEHLIKLYNAGLHSSFVSKGLKVYSLHSQLWLLIALYRVSIDQPKEISKYKNFLISILHDKNLSHSLINYWSTETLVQCKDSGYLKYSKKIKQKIQSIRHSSFKPIDAHNEGVRSNINASRPSGYEEPENYFYVGFNFRNYKINSLSRTFGVPQWEVCDSISDKVRLLDQTIKYSNDCGGRDFYYQNQDQEHTYGEYLSWHALHQVAADLLINKPTLFDEYHPEGRWDDWLSKFTITNNNSLWASDGIDIMPHDIPRELLKWKNEVPTLLNKRDVFLNLISEHDTSIDGYIIDGAWSSVDNVSITISSALINSSIKKSLTKALSKESGVDVYLPKIDVYDGVETTSHTKKNGFIPWTCYHETNDGIDIDDPFGNSAAHTRTTFSKDISSILEIHSPDPFNRFWLNSSKEIVAQGQAWMGAKSSESTNGNRLVIDKKTLQRLLRSERKKLVILLELKFEIKTGNEQGYYATTATFCIDENLKIIFHKGANNEKLNFI